MNCDRFVLLRMLSLLKPTVVFLYLLIIPINDIYGKEVVFAAIDGQEYKLSDFNGKWVVINYWATGCLPCVKEISMLSTFYRQHQRQNDVAVLGINFEQIDEEKVTKFVQFNQVPFPILLADPDEIGLFGWVRQLPTTYIVSPEGQWVHQHVGQLNLASLEQWIRQGRQR